MDGKAAAQKVRDAHKAFHDNVVVLQAARGAEYEAAKEKDKPLWQAYKQAKQDLRDHIEAMYGVGFYDLEKLVRG